MLWPLGSPKRATKQVKFVFLGPPFLMALASTPPPPPHPHPSIYLYPSTGTILGFWCLILTQGNISCRALSLSSACQPELSDCFFLYSVLA